MLFPNVLKYLEAIDTGPRSRPLPSPKSPKLILGTIWLRFSPLSLSDYTLHYPILGHSKLIIVFWLSLLYNLFFGELPHLFLYRGSKTKYFRAVKY